MQCLIQLNWPCTGGFQALKSPRGGSGDHTDKSSRGKDSSQRGRQFKDGSNRGLATRSVDSLAHSSSMDKQQVPSCIPGRAATQILVALGRPTDEMQIQLLVQQESFQQENI